MTSATKASGSTDADVKIVIEGVQSIIKSATDSGVKLDVGEPGSEVAGGGDKAGAALVGKQSTQADAGAAALLAAEVAKADPWAMIDKIKDAKIPSSPNTDTNASKNDAGILATKLPSNDSHNGAKTNADLAAAVALKAMTKGGKFSAQSGETEAIKAAASNAVNKVLGILDFLIRKSVISNLDKVKEVVKGIEYSENKNIGEATEAKN
ncbi:Variable major protein (plasmid) [Borrelia coriaceae ATCC 43381]|uniref:Variable large protein n=1 Tax=Borrelia coriaceae ATCC 43381 TaxID=1408429 RepID=W5SWR2_9SPIR|nr:Variable major protein [Borrelia coriaceae ATCC 43381]